MYKTLQKQGIHYTLIGAGFFHQQYLSQRLQTNKKLTWQDHPWLFFWNNTNHESTTFVWGREFREFPNLEQGKITRFRCDVAIFQGRSEMLDGKVCDGSSSGQLVYQKTTLIINTRHTFRIPFFFACHELLNDAFFAPERDEMFPRSSPTWKSLEGIYHSYNDLKKHRAKKSRVAPAVRLGGILVCNLSASGFTIWSMKGEPSE